MINELIEVDSDLFVWFEFEHRVKEEKKKKKKLTYLRVKLIPINILNFCFSPIKLFIKH